MLVGGNARLMTCVDKRAKEREETFFSCRFSFFHGQCCCYGILFCPLAVFARKVSALNRGKGGAALMWSVLTGKRVRNYQMRAAGLL